MKTEIIRLVRVAKSIEGNETLDNINLTVNKGEILGILGLNGSGKSTLVELIAGAIIPDRGRVYIDNEVEKIQTQSDANRLGIHIIRPNTKLVPNLNIAENIFTIRENKSARLVINFREIYESTQRLLKTIGLDLEPDRIVRGLTLLEGHLVEIAKAINEGVRVIVMDDVMDEYSPKDFKILKRVLNNLCQQGIAVLFTSRKLEVVLDLADRITVLRDGTTIRTLYRDEFSKQNLIKLLIGRNFETSFSKSGSNIGEEVMRLEKISTNTCTQKISLVLHRGEILSLLDFEGKFSENLAQTLVGDQKLTSGAIWLEDKKIRIRNYPNAVQQGIGLVPETWSQDIFYNMSLDENLDFLIQKKMSQKFWILNPRIGKFAVQTFFEIFNTDGKTSRNFNAYDLNQTERLKIILFRWFLRKPRVLVMIKPSLRIDPVARQCLYKLIENLSNEGIAILLIATDLAEAAAISDRVIVIQNRKMKGEYSYQEVQSLSVDDIL